MKWLAAARRRTCPLKRGIPRHVFVFQVEVLSFVSREGRAATVSLLLCCIECENSDQGQMASTGKEGMGATYNRRPATCPQMSAAETTPGGAPPRCPRGVRNVLNANQSRSRSMICFVKYTRTHTHTQANDMTLLHSKRCSASSAGHLIINLKWVRN